MHLDRNKWLCKIHNIEILQLLCFYQIKICKKYQVRMNINLNMLIWSLIKALGLNKNKFHMKK